MYTTEKFYTSLNSQKNPSYYPVSLCLVKAKLHELFKLRDTFLHKKEEITLQLYEYDLRKKSYLLGRAAAKKALKNIDSEISLETAYLIENGAMGEPMVINKDLKISISHTGDFGIAIASPLILNFGIDIETIKNIEKIDPSTFKEEEYGLFQKFKRLFNIESIKCFLWVAKEALTKFLKTGMTIHFNALDLCKIDIDGVVITAAFKNFPFVRVSMINCGEFIVGVSFYNNSETSNMASAMIKLTNTHHKPTSHGSEERTKASITSTGIFCETELAECTRKIFHRA